MSYASARLPAPSSAAVLGNNEDDDEYMRFVQSLLDDSVSFALLEDDEDEFHMSDIEEEEDDEIEIDVDVVDMHEDPAKIETQHELGALMSGQSTPSLTSAPGSPGKNTNSRVAGTTGVGVLDSEQLNANGDCRQNFHADLADEVGSLLEEDLEAAVATLLTNHKLPTTVAFHAQQLPVHKKPSAVTPRPSPKVPASVSTSKKVTITSPSSAASSSTTQPATPLRDAARHCQQTPVTYTQAQQLRTLMRKHYQLLVQQAILAIRAAQTLKEQPDASATSDFQCGESADDLAELLYGSVGMLQDLDQNRKDAIRNSIQLGDSTRGKQTTGRTVFDVDRHQTRHHDHHYHNSRHHHHRHHSKPPPGRRSLFSNKQADEQPMATSNEFHSKRLTRSAFSKTLQLQSSGGVRRTAFDIPGLCNLEETFRMIDSSIDRSTAQRNPSAASGPVVAASAAVASAPVPPNILDAPTHVEACRLVLSQARAQYDENAIPGSEDLSKCLSQPDEYLGEGFEAPCTPEQSLFLRKNRNFFTSAEDNLVFRGVNLYGEKQWILIADRYLPDRSVNIISQRYSKLCLMLYKAHGIEISKDGQLAEPPKHESVDDIDGAKIVELQLEKVPVPTLWNVHRWSLVEDLTLLKAVPIFGTMWAEMGARLIPHRDRGHLRKRYQVLERRVKATVQRISKKGKVPAGRKPSDKPKKSPKPSRASGPLPSTSPITSSKVPSSSFAFLKSVKSPSSSLNVETGHDTFDQLRPPNAEFTNTADHSKLFLSMGCDSPQFASESLMQFMDNPNSENGQSSKKMLGSAGLDSNLMHLSEAPPLSLSFLRSDPTKDSPGSSVDDPGATFLSNVLKLSRGASTVVTNEMSPKFGTSHFSGFDRSPLPNHSLLDSSFPRATTDDFVFQPADSNLSRNEFKFEDLGMSNSSRWNNNSQPFSPSKFNETNSLYLSTGVTGLGMEENDAMQAASALNSLSESPCSRKRPSSSDEKPAAADLNGESRSCSPPKKRTKSLFSAVLGN